MFCMLLCMVYLAFSNVSRIFNTNNLWMKLAAVKRLVEEKKMDMEIITNNKVFLKLQYFTIQLKLFLQIEYFKHSVFM